MEKSRYISLAEVREHATNIVAEFGKDYLYPRVDAGLGPGCHYVREGKPSCLIGQILFRCGMPLNWLHSWENCRPSMLLYEEDNSGNIWIAEPEVVNLLSEMQRMQDSGSTWGECVALIPAE